MQIFNTVKSHWKQVSAAAGTLFLSAAVHANLLAEDPFLKAADKIEDKIEAWGPELLGVTATAVLLTVGIKYIKKIAKAS